MKRVQFRANGAAYNVIAETEDHYILDGHPTNWGEVYRVALPKVAMTVVVETEEN